VLCWLAGCADWLAGCVVLAVWLAVLCWLCCAVLLAGCAGWLAVLCWLAGCLRSVVLPG
jgi:hypothetical protein